MAAKRYELTDTQWDRIKDLIPRAKTGRPPKDDRLMLNAMLWLARSGAAWADIPKRYGPHQSVYSRFCKWRDDGTLLRIFQALNADADYENLCIDSTAIKAHPQSAGAKKGYKFRKQPVYWNKPWWKDHRNSHDCGRFRESGSLHAHWRASARFGSCSRFTGWCSPFQKQYSRRQSLWCKAHPRLYHATGSNLYYPSEEKLRGALVL